MPLLVPSAFAVDTVPYSEQRVLAKLIAGLDDSWYVVPCVPIALEGRDFEIDVILVHPTHGVYVVEVKGGRISMVEGVWHSYGKPMDKNPVEQIRNAKYALRKRLRTQHIDLKHFPLHHIVAFPDIADFPAEGAGPDCPRELVFTGTELDSPGQFLTALESSKAAPTPDKVVALLKALRPDITDADVAHGRFDTTSQRLRGVASDRLGPVIGLDENLRVYLRGAAGTGKTFVAGRWVWRAVNRGDDTMYVCFNKPLADEMTRVLVNDAEYPDGSTPPLVDTFHGILMNLLGDDAPAVPEGAGALWWSETLPALFAERLPTLSRRFDTVVIDEAQDFPDHWRSLVERLLRDPATSRLYMMADSKQAIYVSDWQPPSGVTTLELTVNVRNSRQVASLLEGIGGAETSRSAPVGPKVTMHSVGGRRECVKAVKAEIEHVTGTLGIPPSQIIIITTHVADRDAIIEGASGDIRITRWEDRDEESIGCETVHRTKGLERHAVIYVDMDDDPSETLAYVGMSRSAGYLAVIGKESLRARLTNGRD